MLSLPLLQPLNAVLIKAFLTDNPGCVVEPFRRNLVEDVELAYRPTDDLLRFVAVNAGCCRIEVEDAQVHVCGRHTGVRGGFQQTVKDGLIVQGTAGFAELPILLMNDFAQEAGVAALQPLEQVGLGEDTAEPPVLIHNHQTADLLHPQDVDHIRQVDLLGDRADRLAHHLLKPGVIKIHPLQAETDHIAFSEDTDRPPFLIRHWHATDVVLVHLLQSGMNRIYRSEGNDLPRDQLLDRAEVNEILQAEGVEKVAFRDNPDRPARRIRHNQMPRFGEHHALEGFSAVSLRKIGQRRAFAQIAACQPGMQAVLSGTAGDVALRH